MKRLILTIPDIIPEIIILVCACCSTSDNPNKESMYQSPKNITMHITIVQIRSAVKVFFVFMKV